MANIERDPASGNWRIRIYFEKKQYFRSCDTTDEETARTILGTVHQTIRILKMGVVTIPDGTEDIAEFLMKGGKMPEKTEKVDRKTLKEAIDAYFAAIPSGAKEANSLLTERIHLGHFQRLLKATIPIRAIGVPALQKYVVDRSNESGIRGRTVKAGTIRKELVTFGQLWRFAKANNWVGADYDRKAIKLPKTAEKPPFQTWEEIETKIKAGGLTDAEVSDLWDCLFLRGKEILALLAYVEKNGKAPWLYPALAIAAYTGARRSEIMRSECADFDFKRPMVLLREKKRQRGKITFRTVDFHDDLQEIIREWFKQGHPGGKYTICAESNVPLTPDEADRTFQATTADSKWKVLRGYHVLRHSFASLCAMKAVPEHTISRWMGHETEEMKKRYRHLYPEQTKRAMQKLFG
jgi:integrase